MFRRESNDKWIEEGWKCFGERRKEIREERLLTFFLKKQLKNHRITQTKENNNGLT